MKKMLLISALSLGISFLSLANPNEKLMELTSVRSSYKKVRVTFSEPMEKVFVSILDAEGAQIVKTKYKTKEPVTVPYDLSNLPAGDYKIKVETKDEIAVYEITTVEKKVTKAPLMAYGKLQSNNTINLLVVGLEKPGVTVDIYNELNQKIKSEFIDQPEGFSKNYRFVNHKPQKIYFHLQDSQGRSKYVYPKEK
jgi:hypothetical protein